MGLIKYIFGSLVLIVGIFGYVFSIESGDYRLAVMDFVFVLPVAVWIVLPMALLFVVTMLHIIYYGSKNYFTIKGIAKDSKSMVTLISNKLLNQDSNITFKNDEAKVLSDIIKQLNISIDSNGLNTSNETINKVVEQLESIKDGKYLSPKELKLEKNNPIMVENLKNKIDTDENFALEAIKQDSNYSKDVIKKAFIKVVETKSMTTIKKHIENIDLDKDMLNVLIKKDSEERNDFSLTNEMILKMINKAKLSNYELMNIAKMYKTSMSPDQIIKLYEDIYTSNEEYTSAYLYVLSEYEMIDNIRDILLNSEATEFTSYKALIDLKDAGKNTYSLDTICYK